MAGNRHKKGKAVDPLTRGRKRVLADNRRREEKRAERYEVDPDRRPEDWGYRERP